MDKTEKEIERKLNYTEDNLSKVTPQLSKVTVLTQWSHYWQCCYKFPYFLSFRLQLYPWDHAANQLPNTLKVQHKIG